MNLKECPCCYEDFEPEDDNQIYCSERCQQIDQEY